VTGDNRRANAEADIAAGFDALRAAEALLGLAIFRDAMSRAYYAAFHAARPLPLEGIEPETHAGVLRVVATGGGDRARADGQARAARQPAARAGLGVREHARTRRVVDAREAARPAKRRRTSC
jgi:hypothetical protein